MDSYHSNYQHGEIQESSCSSSQNSSSTDSSSPLQISESKFNRTKFFNDYSSWFSRSRTDDLFRSELINSATPLVDLTRSVYFNDLPKQDAEEVISSMLESIVIFVDERRFLPGDPKSLMSVIVRHLHNVGIDAVRSINSFKRPFDYLAEGVDPPSGRINSPYQIFSAIYLKEVIGSVDKLVKLRIRFGGSKKDMCEDILESRLTSNPVFSDRLKHVYRCKNPDFFIGYVDLLIKHSLYKIVEDPRYGFNSFDAVVEESNMFTTDDTNDVDGSSSY